MPVFKYLFIVFIIFSWLRVTLAFMGACALQSVHLVPMETPLGNRAARQRCSPSIAHIFAQIPKNEDLEFRKSTALHPTCTFRLVSIKKI